MKFLRNLTIHRAVDRFGALTALLCAVHCAAVPLALALIPALTLALYQFGSPLHGVVQWMLLSHSFERIFAALALSLCAMSLLLGWRQHRRLRAFVPWVIALLAFGFGTLTPIAFVPFWHAVLLVTGGIAISAAHLWNLKLTRAPKVQLRAHGPVMATLKPGS
jgi:MerC mercury resistance protein